MLSGSVDIAYSGSDSVIKAYAKKLPVRVIAAANNNQPAGDTDSAGLVVPASIGSPAELEGKTLATNALNNVNQIYTQNYLEKNGVDPKKSSSSRCPSPSRWLRSRPAGSSAPCFRNRSCRRPSPAA